MRLVDYAVILAFSCALSVYGGGLVLMIILALKDLCRRS